MSEQIFTWIPFYEEFATLLYKKYQKKNDRAELVDLLNPIVSDFGTQEGQGPRKFSDKVSIIDIDPFTIFSYINSWGLTKRIKLLHLLADVFSISCPVPVDCMGVPSTNGTNCAYFEYSSDSIEHQVPQLWKLFSAAL